jgi:2-polyprenyl-3-methyl-5-hydroxy-6-metoxy-1,4-benzoquinol methylase
MAPFGPLFAAGAGRRLLDFGCGNGLLDLAHARGFECYGVDLAEDAIEHARRKPTDVTRTTARRSMCPRSPAAALT